MKRAKFSKCSAIIIAGILSLFFISLASAEIYNLCLTKGQTLKLSLCNPSMADKLCTKTVCQYCVNEIRQGVYCSLPLNQCADPDCRYLSASNATNTTNTSSGSSGSITVLSPENGYSSENPALTFSFRLTNVQNYLNCAVFLNNNLAAYNSSRLDSLNNKISLNLSTGNFSWFIRCFDKNSNYTDSAQRSISILRNSSLIYIDLASPAENSSAYSGVQNFLFSVSDQSRIKECSIVLNGNSTGSINSTNPNQANLTLAAGNYNWSVSCLDSSGSSWTSSERTLYISDIPVVSGGGGGGGSSGGGSSGGGSSGGGSYCGTKYNCSEWGECIDGVQTRTCTIPKGMCVPATKAKTNQPCTAAAENITEPVQNTETEKKSTNLFTGALVKLKSRPITMWSSIIVIVAIIILLIIFFSFKGKKEKTNEAVQEPESQEKEEEKPAEKKKK